MQETNYEYQPAQAQPNYQYALPNATAVLVMGILSILSCFCYGLGIVFGAIAIYLAGKDAKLYAAYPQQYTAGSLANLKAGKICGIIGLIISILFLALVVIFWSVIGTEALKEQGLFRDI
ncbi:MAG TPA: hypothetical protein DIW54_11160 [Chitinophagaceae bacterium]|nr:hypothetical protein [Chitinophagaceae bacterium]HCT23843.1 hypothetical protein [Chitinophagaceae bacterium]